MHETTLKQLYEVLDKETMTSSPTIFPKDFVGKEAKDTLKRLLPHQIIGYSSGLNELVSNPFIRMQFNYFYDYRKGLEDGLPEIGGGSRLSFMDYDSNALVLLSNYLTQDEETKDKLKTVNDKIEVEGIDSFRLVICGDLKDETFEETDELAFVDGSIFQPYSDAINSLMKCATTFKIDVNQNNNFLFIEEPELHLTPTQGKKAKEIIRDNQYLHNNQIIFDFKVTDATKEVFKHYFGSAKKLYQFLQRLNTLNINTFTEEQIETVRKADKDFNISSYLPKKSNDELLFYVDKLQLKKTNNDKPIAYNGLSDGEHQFLHIIGTTLLMDEPDTIFFLDEPETHYNPMWRSKLVSTLNEVAGDTGSRQQMFVITTHSPFILSDCYQENVFKFKREEGQPPKAEMISTKTYGASFDVLLSEAFDIEATISKLSNEEIEKQYQKSMDTLEQIEAIKDEIRPLGESVEKILLFEYLNRKKRSLKK